MGEEELLDVVDENDRVIGRATRGECHRKGLLHRSVSVFVFNSEGLFLIQQRSASKVLNASKWDRSVAGHVLSGQSWEEAARRELEEESGIRDVALRFVCSLVGRETYPEQGLIENEVFQIFECTTMQTPVFADGEVTAFRWVKLDDVARDLTENPSKYSKSFSLSLESYMKAEGLA